MHYQRWGADNRLLITSQPGTPAVERLQWACDVKNAVNGTESRQSLRKNPITSLTFEHPIHKHYIQDIMGLISLNTSNWSVALWHLAVQIDRPEPVGTTINVGQNHAWHGFGTSGTCAIYNPMSLEDINILPYTRSGNTLTVTGAITVKGGGHVNKVKLSVAPVLDAEIVSSRTLSGDTGVMETLSIEYHLSESTAAGDLSMIPTVDGYDFFSLPTLEDDEIDAVENESRIFHLVGGEQFVRNVAQPVVSRRIIWSGDWNSTWLVDNIYYFRSFIWQRQGRSRSFLRNSFRRDIDGFTTINAGSLVASTTLNADLAAYLTQVPYLALHGENQFEYGIHKLSSVSGRTINIDSATPVDTTKRWRWGEICYMTRLAGDDVTFQWNEQGLVDCSVSTRNFILDNSNSEAKERTIGYTIS